MKDPLLSEGGSPEVVRREIQAIRDLRERTVAIRRAIAEANAREVVVIDGAERTIADWLVWRREVAPKLQALYGTIAQGINGVRQEAMRKGSQVVAANAPEIKPNDVIVNVSEGELARQIEALETTLGVLDGVLSLKNATITIEV